MNYRKYLIFSYLKAKGIGLPAQYEDLKKHSYLRNYENVEEDCLLKILTHGKNNVPYYQKIFDFPVNREVKNLSNKSILNRIPVLTKSIIRQNFDMLQSRDLDKRKWYYNTSGGSTGEPIRLIQDLEHQNRAQAITHLYYWLVGHEIGRSMVKLWGSERDILGGGIGTKAKVKSIIWNIRMMNAFRMTPEKMKQYISRLNSKPPNLILAYAQSIYELALFAESNNIRVSKQRAVMTSAGTLYPFMREKIEVVFGCPVFNRYGSREVGDIACEHPESRGLWVAPWGCYIEIVDEHNNPVPPGTEGDILVTSMTNFAMPLIRYKIGDRGILASESKTPSGQHGQILAKVSGRNVDMFKCRDGTLIDGEYFTHLLYFRDWVQKFQFIQKDFDLIIVNLMKSNDFVPEAELDEITKKIEVILGKECRVKYNFVEDIPPSSSGKYRYTISEVVCK